MTSSRRQFFMLGFGLIWSMVTSWQLTLTGLGIAPLFVRAPARFG